MLHHQVHVLISLHVQRLFSEAKFSEHLSGSYNIHAYM